jgi:hypothetical protein
MQIERGYYREDDIANKLHETVEYQPELLATGLAYTDNPITGFYTKIGNLVHVRIRVECSKFLNGAGAFTPGTGTFTCTLPFESVAHACVIGGMYHDASTDKRHMIVGQVEQGSNVLTFYSLNGQVEMQELDHTHPFRMAAADFWHLEGWYEGIIN